MNPRYLWLIGVVVVLVIVLLPTYVYRTLLILLPAPLAFMHIPTLLPDDPDDADILRGGLWLAALMTGGVILVQIVLLPFGERVFVGNLLTVPLLALIGVGLPVLIGGGMGAWLLPHPRTIIIAGGTMGVGFGLLLVDVLLNTGLLLISALPVSIISAAFAAWDATRHDCDSETALRAGMIAGVLSSVPVAATLALTVRLLLCLGATTCANQHDLAGLLLLILVYALVLLFHVIPGFIGAVIGVWMLPRSRP